MHHAVGALARSLLAHGFDRRLRRLGAFARSEPFTELKLPCRDARQRKPKGARTSNSAVTNAVKIALAFGSPGHRRRANVPERFPSKRPWQSRGHVPWAVSEDESKSRYLDRARRRTNSPRTFVAIRT